MQGNKKRRNVGRRFTITATAGTALALATMSVAWACVIVNGQTYIKAQSAPTYQSTPYLAHNVPGTGDGLQVNVKGVNETVVSRRCDDPANPYPGLVNGTTCPLGGLPMATSGGPDSWTGGGSVPNGQWVPKFAAQVERPIGDNGPSGNENECQLSPHVIGTIATTTGLTGMTSASDAVLPAGIPTALITPPASPAVGPALVCMSGIDVGATQGHYYFPVEVNYI